MTPPPLTQALQRLEAALGARLFERNQRHVALSAAGVALLPQARRLLAAAEALPGAAQAAAAGLSGQLRLAFVSSIAYGPLPGWLSGFRRAYPEVAIALREATLDVQLDEFASDEIDAGFVLHARGACPPGFDALRVLDEPMVLALPDGHPALRDSARVRWAAIVDEPLVIFPRQIAPSLFDALVSSYHAGGHALRIAQQAIQMQTIVNLVSGGMGVAWVPESVTRLQRPGVRYCRVDAQPGPALRCETSLVWPAGASPVVRRFVAHVDAALAPAARGRAGMRRQSAPQEVR